MTIEHFKSIYKTVDGVMGISNQGMLFESLCYLIENESNDEDVMNALSIILKNYVKLETNKKQDIRNGEAHTEYKLNLLSVPISVAEAINERAHRHRKMIVEEKQRTEQEIISLLKGKYVEPIK